jgi:hypothetical protein
MRASVFLALSALTACSSSSSPSSPGDSGADSNPLDAGNGHDSASNQDSALRDAPTSDGPASDGPGSDGGPSDSSGPCVEKDSFFYTIDVNFLLGKFDPTTGVTTPIGTITVSGWDGGNLGSGPQTFAVDANGDGWIMFAPTAFNLTYLFKLDMTTAVATPTSYQPGTLVTTGMGVAWTSSAQTSDLLYAADFNQRTVETIDRTTFASTTLGSLGSPWNTGTIGLNLAGDGNGRLFGFASNTNPPVVAELNKTDASLLSDYEVATAVGLGFNAMAVWGGYLWLFAPTSMSETDASLGESVIKYQYSTQTATIAYPSVTSPVTIANNVSMCPAL